MRVLLVRPGQQGEASARRLVLRGHAPLAVPLLTVQAIGGEPPPEMPDALLVTSQNAAQALAGEAGRLGAVPVYAVGAATARAVTRAGYATVHRSGGDGAALARQVAAALPHGARLLHVAGRDRRAEPERSLTRAGFAVSVWEAYAAESAPALPGIVGDALADGRLDAALHYSRRSAETLVRLVHEAGLTEPLRALVHLCLSREVARGLDALSPSALRVAAEPTEEALFAALDRLSAKPDISQARAEPATDATQGTNPAARHSRTVKDDPPSMSETRRQDPLRRAPPTIDLKAEEVGAAAAASNEAKHPAGVSGPAGMSGPAPEAGATSVEPVATTGLGSDPFPSKSTPPDAKPAAPKSPDPKPAEKPPGQPSPAGPASSPTKTPPIASTPTSPATSSTGSPVTAGIATPKPDPAKPDVKPATKPASPSQGSVPSAGKGSGTLGTAAGAAASVAAADAIARSGPATTTSSTAATPKAPAPPLPESAFRAGDAAPPPPRAKAGLGSLLTAGLLGGVAGAAVAAALMQALPSRTDAATGERLAAMERRLSAAPAASQAGTPDPRIAALETGLKQAGEEARAARASADAAAKQAADAAGRPLPAAATDPSLRPAIDALSARVEDGGKRSEANASAIRDLGAKLGEGLATGAAAVAAVESSLRGVQTELGTVKTSTGTIDTRSAESARRLDALTGQVTGVAGDLARLSPAASQAGLRLVVSGRLDEALRTGTPLGPVTAALERLGVEAGLLAPLKPYADVAPPLPAALAAEFKPLAAALTTEPAASDESIADKMKRLVGKVVTVRAVGDGSGTDVPGLVARIESALTRGAVGEAAAAWNGFPESAKRVTSDWSARLKARAAAEDGARRIGSQALAALDTVSSGPSGAAARPAPTR